ncbi:pyridoxamine 5'-phosphate oxidase [Haloarcula hispanica N601]|uniref:Pyridoxamine 5'-phosphate oxidase family protein n=3 Tax=Haloarcula hispanica TaxID=51589 RepID=A0A482T4H2_HALHI|nr:MULTISPECIES: pyridoxamine 5'-phosphate oxidase family protein [Haloarcula]AEM59116.1 pyridoxamine 5'-phosphate oxidase-related FMN-binding protein [Haloarcula hispanica ATCC 33960]AHB67805.1 pyridoxamine 5'-phosphate oxidase [Haloarcula hispanica N601]AJF24253.1 pyridoxamine 5'-phosphate oxidase [Haloarcula sp. CBA1115]KAA9400836.1 pyridoxamine 5'-phosphate oxidase family protein [Haloarcula sp. CBA1131]KAA9401133.1 pyridoxamine 5'-phosphate oxidase family protein [Haloarcula sp. CBA1131]
MTIDELTDFGLHKMTDEEVEGFLSSQSMGTLGLPTDVEPYLIPMTYGYNGGGRLYFYFIGDNGSRKMELANQAESAAFLVYSAETAFNWESVGLIGTIQKLPEDRRGELDETTTPTWRPELFETASDSLETQIYEFQIEEWTGVRHTGLPPGFYN